MAQQSVSSDASAAPDRSTLRTSPGHELPGFSPILDSKRVLTELRTIISNGKLSLDAMLQQVVEAAQMVTRADGAAVAIRRGDLVICQARAGDMAPDLGTRLDTGSGISGQCLRTGWALRCDDTKHDVRVDAEVCRRLGLRSLAVVPVGKEPAVSGVLETFSGLPNAFGATQMKLLEELAQLAVAAQRGSAESAVQRLREKLSDATQQSWFKRRLILAAPTVLILLGWLVFRGTPRSLRSSPALLQLEAAPTAPSVTVASAAVLKPGSSSAVRTLNTKSSRHSGVVMASKTEKAHLTKDVVARKVEAEPTSNPNNAPNVPASLTTPQPQNLSSAAEAPSALGTLSTSSETALSALLSASGSRPLPTIRVSQGVSGGTIERKVEPIYPRQALERRLEGRVLLRGIVMEDGRLRDLKVVSGDPLLAQAAMEAVVQWRYRPYRLNGQAIRRPTEITLVFKLP
jgi:TonB family protein